MKLTDGTRIVEIRMQVWNGSGYDPDWSWDFFGAGDLTTDEATGASVVDDVDYCIGQAQAWADKRGGFAEVAPWEESQERFVFVTEEETMTRDLFEDMISNWLTDTSPAHDNLTITDIRFEDDKWVGYAEDDKHCYHLTDQDRDGNIVINYVGTK